MSTRTVIDPNWYVYIIRASDDSLYTGVTTNVQRRFAEHGHADKRARYFRGRKPQEVVYTELLKNRSSAQRREAEIKKLTRKGKLKLVDEYGIKPPGRPC
ncbi:GIY-YIG nuclease family protein [Pseudomonadota bacterium]